MTWWSGPAGPSGLSHIFQAHRGMYTHTHTHTHTQMLTQHPHMHTYTHNLDRHTLTHPCAHTHIQTCPSRVQACTHTQAYPPPIHNPTCKDFIADEALLTSSLLPSLPAMPLEPVLGKGRQRRGWGSLGPPPRPSALLSLGRLGPSAGSAP